MIDASPGPDPAMSGERDLRTLLRTLSPRLHPDDYVFCVFPQAEYGDHAELEPVAAMCEAEGLSLVIPLARARAAGCRYEGVFRCITLQVHSSLDAVGLTACIARRLTERGISANVIAGHTHDHVFVQAAQAVEALTALEALSGEARGDA